MRAILSLLLLVSVNVIAAPFLVSDADSTKAADKCVYQEGAAAVVETPLVSAACKIDLAAFSSGTHNLQVWFRSSLWGVDSAKVPFAFTRPAAGATGPSTLQIVP